MSSSYLHNHGITGGLNVAGHIEANKINNVANGHKGNTPTNLGNSSSFIRHQQLGAAGVVNGLSLANSRAVVQTQKRGPSAEAQCGAGSASAKNQFLPPSGALGNMRSQSFNADKAGQPAGLQ